MADVAPQAGAIVRPRSSPMMTPSIPPRWDEIYGRVREN